MTATERAKRSDALYYETVSVNRRVLCDMIANRESDLEDARAESEHMRLKALAVMGELQEESERLKADNAKLRDELDAAKHDLSLFSERIVELGAENAKLRELVRDMFDRVNYECRCCSIFCSDWDEENECCVFATSMRELGIEV